MKTTFLCVAAVLAAVLLVSATVWEGVTDVAFAKDLPRAYSIATNSFPRNTMVDVTNLENGKMVRVIVISGLETTGLLATLSKNAADAIDLRHDSTCRIRMTQTSVNASQYARAGSAPPVLQLGPIDTTGAVASTTEDEAPASRPPAAESAPVASRAPATETAPVASNAPVTNNATPASKPAAAETAPVTTKPPVTESAPVASRAPVTNNTTPASKPAAAETAPVTTKPPVTESAPVASRAPATESSPSVSSAPATENAPVVTRIITPELPAIADIAAVDEPDALDDVIAVEEPIFTEDDIIAIDEPIMSDNVIAADEPAITDNAVTVGEPAGAITESQPEPRAASGMVTLVPADERAPPAHETAAASNAAPHSGAPRTAAPETAVSRTTVPTDAAPPVTQPAETPAAYIPPSDEFSPFQAPLISSLEQGKWYVQIGVYSRPDNVEDEISRIGTTYPVAIQNIGSDASPMFRVLLGPLNQGESGAMLQRFRSIGYADAFVRHN